MMKSMHRLLHAANDGLALRSRSLLLRFLRRVLDRAKPYLGETGVMMLSNLRRQNIASLLKLADSLSSQSYDDATHHFVANQVASCIRKVPFPKSLVNLDPDGEALRKFLDAEELCSKANERLREDHFEQLDHLKWHRMQTWIAYVLGNFPSLADWYSLCNFGPGASVGVRGSESNLKQKIASDWTTSPSASDYGYAAFALDSTFLALLANDGKDSGEAWGPICFDGSLLHDAYRRKIHYVDHNNIAFVPKTASCSRTIAVEPLINGYLQRGVDHLMRSRLLRIGIDLTLQEPNSEMARLGSLSESDAGFVTIDLSSASDSICEELVRRLLPYDWFFVMDQIRSHYYKLPSGAKKRYMKFCSMGNGFCFPLETLLFTAACHAVGAGKPGLDFRVYGDDIIVRQRFAGPLIELLSEMGFTVNTKKTFIDGPFRESCGRDWFGGVDVRPFVLDFVPATVQDWFKVLNLTRRNELTTWFFLPLRDEILSWIPADVRFVRPFEGPADTAITVELDDFMSSRFSSWDCDIQGWKWREIISEAAEDRRSARREQYALMIAALTGASSDKPFTLRILARTTIRWKSGG